MLTVLRVRNFILMESLELKLEPGFNVLTGETGAGKSIIVGALSLVLGGRASAEQVRPSADEAEVEALFDIGQGSRLSEKLNASGIANDGELVVRRVVLPSGRSRAYLNGRLCTAGELQAIAPDLADVASQHESVALTDPSTHLGYLDRFARLVDASLELSGEVRELEELVRKLADARELERTRAEREAFVAFQLQSIDAVSPHAGEVDTLNNERNRLRHAGRLSEVTQRIAVRLEQGEGAICDEVSRLAAELHAAAELDGSLLAAAERLSSCFSELREIGREMERYSERTDADPQRLSDIEERLYRLEGLMRQYGPTLDDVIASRVRLSAELSAFGEFEGKTQELEQKRDELFARVGDKARELSKKRRASAMSLGASISKELSELAMGGARVVVDVAPLGGDKSELAIDGARLGPEGIDRVEFLISPNKGIEPRPLRKIASGGELSRALLALKRVLAEGGPAGLYVFDEVDSGVGGSVADKIGRAIADVARHHQVLCITHLAPIAAFANAHFVVSKETRGSGTTSAVTRVLKKDRIAEIARMLSGAKVTTSSLKAATELVEDAHAN